VRTEGTAPPLLRAPGLAHEVPNTAGGKPLRMPRYTHTVRKLFFIVLLAILPIQFSWAAVAAYCRHESGEATRHLGHHEHQHRAAKDGDSTDRKASSSLLADQDCGACQLGAAQPIPPSVIGTPAADSEPPRFTWSISYDSCIPAGPERPDRSAPTPAVRFGGAVVIGALPLA
jgi:hypothetical protein